ncbi:MAG: hypothetical protein V3T00_10170 [bacterium]
MNALGIVFGMLALAGSGLTWSLSRAAKIRAFEESVFAQLTTANARMELVEKAFQAHQLEISGMCDEMLESAERAAKARRRITAENARADRRVEAEDPQGGHLPEGTDRESEKRKVMKLLGVS